ncbi:MAG: Gldg family protein [Rhodospirillaceae bacterium]|nr:Gldg family protein [Rhodospirillaceae bacterium]
MMFLDDRRKLAGATLIVAFVLLFALNAFVGNVARNLSVDLTRDKEFTLSDGTRQVLKSLEEPVTLRLFISPSLIKQIPSYAAAASRVRNLLDRYVLLSNGKIRLEVYRPEPFSVDEDKATAYGLEGVPIDQQGEQVYFGLAGTNTVDAEEKITFFHPSRQRFIEYDITRLVHSLGTKKKVVGVIAGLPIQGTFSMRGGMRPAWPIMGEVEKLFEVKSIGARAESIPDDVDVLMIAHPQQLSDKMLYSIDQHVMNGGRALIMVDPVPETAPRRRTFMGPGPTPSGSDLPRLLKAWGVKYDVSSVATDAERYVQVPYRYQDRVMYAPHIAYIQVRDLDLNLKDPVTAEVETLIFGIPGYFEKIGDAETTITPLVTTSPTAMVRKAQDYRQEPDLLGIYRSYVPGDKKRWLAVRVTGKAKSAFPKGRPAEKEENSKDADKKHDGLEHIAAARKPLNVILIADADFMETRFWARTQGTGQGEVQTPFANNADFVVNALDDLASANPLIKLRGRGSPVRPFTVVDDLRKASQNKLRAKQRELADDLSDVRKKIADARTQSKDGRTVLTEEQQATLSGYMAKLITIRQEQRSVLTDLRKDVDALEVRTKFYNIALIPLMITVLAILVAIWRVRRRRRYENT